MSETNDLRGFAAGNKTERRGGARKCNRIPIGRSHALAAAAAAMLSLPSFSRPSSIGALQSARSSKHKSLEHI